MSTPEETAARIHAALRAKVEDRRQAAMDEQWAYLEAFLALPVHEQVSDTKARLAWQDFFVPIEFYFGLAKDVQRWKDSFRQWSPTFPQQSPTYREEYVSRRGWHLSPQVERILTTIEVTCVASLDGWPDGWMTLADSGAETAYIVDLYTGRVYEDGVYLRPDELQVYDEQLQARIRRENYIYGYRYRFASVRDLLEYFRSTTHWGVTIHQPPVEPICIGIIGPHGFSPSLAFGTVEGMALNLPRSEDFYVDEDSYVSFEEFVESGDSDWYQRQSPYEE